MAHARPTRPSPGARALPWTRRLVLALTLATVAGAVSLGLVEIGFRLVGAYRPYTQHALPPNQTLRDLQTGWDVEYRTNALGFRGPERDFARSPGVPLRIVSIGDSYAFGQGVELEQTFASVLERTLRAEGHPAEVIDVSNIGINAESYYVLLKDVGLRYRPDVVIVTFFGNDASLAVEPPGYKKVLRRLSHGSHLFTLPRIVNRERAKRRNAKVTADERTYWARLQQECEGHHPAEQCRTIISGFRDAHGSHINNLVNACLTDPGEVRRWVFTDPAGPGWAELAFYAEAMRDLCVDHGCRLVFGIVPDGVQVDPGQLRLRRTLGLSYPESVLSDRGPFQDRVGELAARLEADVYDPLERFRASSEALYFEADLHWNPAGHRLYAEGLLAHLREHDYVTLP